MDLFYIDIQKFREKHDKAFLKDYVEIDTKSEKRYYEHGIGRYLAKTAAKNFYDIKDTDIIVENFKPRFKNSSINFNISHSKNYVVCIFDDAPCAVDIEYMANRNLKPLEKHYNQKFNSIFDFYSFWTKLEAEIKLQNKPINTHTEIFMKEYMISIASVSLVDKTNLRFHDLT